MKVEIFILNYNGKDLLEECLPSILAAAKRSVYKPSVTIVDNMSKDGSKEMVNDLFSDVRFMQMKENRVLSSFNDAAGSSEADIVFLLNNDIKVGEECIDSLVEVFNKYDNVFMASPKFYNYTGDTLECIWFLPQIKKGVFNGGSAHLAGKEESKDVCYTFQCGMAAFDRIKFLELGGFDEIYLPGRVEDSDLCFRAWKRGYKCYYQPKSIMYHKGTASFKKAFKEKQMLSLSHRNIYVFTWKNITDPILLFKHFIFLVPRLFYGLFSFKTEIPAGFFKAIPLIPNIIKKRKLEKKYFVIPDRKLFKLFTGKPVSVK